MDNFENSSDEEDGILKKALHAELPEDFDPSKVPTNGEEYLHHVIYERKHCKKWVTVDIDRSKLKKKTVEIHLNEPIKKAPSFLRPTQEWQERQIKDFMLLRKFVAFNTKDEATNDLVHESHWEKLILKDKPTFSKLTQLKQSAKINLLNLISEYLKSTKESVNSNIGIWIYSTLAVLDVPLSPSDCHELRELAKEMAMLRSRLKSNDETDYKYLNLCICIVAKVFGQVDLADT